MGLSTPIFHRPRVTVNKHMNKDNDADDTTAVWTIATGLIVLAVLLFLVKSVLKFRFVLGVGD